jgi:hypothetical protein
MLHVKRPGRLCPLYSVEALMMVVHVMHVVGG